VDEHAHQRGGHGLGVAPQVPFIAGGHRGGVALPANARDAEGLETLGVEDGGAHPRDAVLGADGVDYLGQVLWRGRRLAPSAPGAALTTRTGSGPVSAGAS